MIFIIEFKIQTCSELQAKFFGKTNFWNFNYESSKIDFNYEKYTANVFPAKIVLQFWTGLYFEIHEDFGEEVIKMLEIKGFNNLEIRQDLQGKNRMIRAVLP